MEAKYRGGQPHILVGHSSGGVIATFAAATRPASFPVVVSIDAPTHLGDDWLAKRLIERARSGGPQPLRYVSLESRFGWSDRNWNALTSTAPATWRLRREKLEGESHESMGFLAMYEGLKSAFGDYSIVGATLPPRGPALGAFDYYRKFEQEFHVLPPPARVLRQLIEDLLTEGRGRGARGTSSRESSTSVASCFPCRRGTCPPRCISGWSGSSAPGSLSRPTSPAAAREWPTRLLWGCGHVGRVG